MNKIKEFFKSRWTYTFTDNIFLLMEFGIVALSMGATLLLLGLTDGTVRGVRDMVVAGVIAVVGLIAVAVVAYKIHKTREEIK